MASKVLVTGGSGLIGRNLQSNHSIVFVSATSEIDLLHKKGAKRIVEKAKTEKCDAILHLAWHSNSQKNYEKAEVNFKWTEQSIEICQHAKSEGIEVILVGTCLEISNIETVSPYLESKLMLKKHFKDEIENRDILWLRPFYIFDPLFLRPRILSEIFFGDVTQKQVNFGSAEHDYIHVSDVASAIEVLLINNAKGVCDIGSGFLTSNRELVMTMCRHLGSATPHIFDSERVFGIVADTSNLSSLGWRPKETSCFFSKNCG